MSRGWIKSYRRRVGRQALYRRADIEALRGLVAPERGRRARSLPDASSWVTVAQPVRGAAEGPAPGVIVTESAVSSIVDGRLAYRGYPIEEVIEHATFEEVCLLLWNGERPTAEAAAELRRRDRFGEDAGSGRHRNCRDGRGCGAVAATLRDDAEPRGVGAPRRKTRPTCACEAHHLDASPAARAKRPRASPDGEGGMAERLLRNVAGAGAADFEIDAMNRVLVACAEHELNASTFAARVVASTGADLYASVLAALCSLSGPIHGGACDRIEEMFAELDHGVRLDECLAVFGREHRLPPGFGHAIYPEGDPRAVLLKQTA